MAADQLVGSEIHGFHTLQDLDIGNIVKDAGRRWLSCHEIYAIICNYKHFCVYSCPVKLPKSGAILLFDCKRQRYFRQDGHNWKKKKDGKTVNESNERLKVGNQLRIHVCYVHGQDNPAFTRRCYRLLDKNPEQDIVLVHYRELKEESGDKHVYYAGNKDFLDEVSSFDQSNQIEKKRQREHVKAQPEGSGSEDKRRRFPTFWDVVCEFKKQSVQNFLEPILESAIRRVVNEVFEKHLNSMKQNCGNEVHTWESRTLQLKFNNNPSLLVFTDALIEGEDCSKIEVALVDAHTAQLVTSGPESSSKVEIVVLEGDFDGDGHGIWTAEEFENNIVKEREGKKPLLTGDTFINLKDGTCVMGEISFTDNSSWTRSSMFRLGVRFVDNIEGIKVREAKTSSFFVLDNCEELFQYCDEEATRHSTAVAQMRWTKVFSVYKWFSVRKAVC